MKTKYFVLMATFLAVLSTPALAEKVLLADFTISSNDSVSLNNMMIVEGKTTAWTEGNYKIQILDSSNNIISSQLLPIEFFISGFGEMNTTVVEARFSNYENAKKMQLLKDNKTIFETTIALCNNNKVCDKYENFLSCPTDCPSGSSDGYCDHQKDGKCDPDCATEADEDCLQINLFAVQNMTYIIAGIGIVVAILIVFLLKRRKTNYIASVPEPKIKQI